MTCSAVHEYRLLASDTLTLNIEDPSLKSYFSLALPIKQPGTFLLHCRVHHLCTVKASADADTPWKKRRKLWDTHTATLKAQGISGQWQQAPASKTTPHLYTWAQALGLYRRLCCCTDRPPDSDSLESHTACLLCLRR